MSKADNLYSENNLDHEIFLLSLFLSNYFSAISLSLYTYQASFINKFSFLISTSTINFHQTYWSRIHHAILFLIILVMTIYCLQIIQFINKWRKIFHYVSQCEGTALLIQKDSGRGVILWHFIHCTPGPWLLWISLVLFSLVRIFKK